MKILFGSYKGGPGKSTLATNFAVMLAELGRDVLLVDSDRQGSSTLWAAIRQKSGRSPSLTCMSAFGESVNAEIDKMAPKFDDVIIDTAGHDAIELRSAMIAADILVTPVEISLFSTATLGQMQEVIRLARVYNRGLRCVLVPNRISTVKGRGASQIERIAQAAESLPEYELSKNALRERVVFADAAELGITAKEGPDKKASSEIEALFKEICHGL